MIAFEDIEIGRRFELGSFTFDAEAIKVFARAYDPQPFHIDEAAAEASHFGGLIASGWHVAAVWMKLLVADMARQAAAGSPVAAGPSPGFRNMAWLKPVRAGDSLTYSMTVNDKRESGSRPGWGIVSQYNEAKNQTAETVFTFEGIVFWQKRPVRS